MSKWLLIKRFTDYKPFFRLAMAIVVVLFCQGSPLAGSAQAPSVEYRVKAAFLFNFTKFVQWPAKNGEAKAQTFQIGILGDDVFGSELDVLAGKTVGNRSLEVQRYPSWDDRAATCDVLFISGSEKENLTEIIRRLNDAPVLTVGDTANYAECGVMINFFMEDNKVRFKINLKKAGRAGFKISSRLLKLAEIVESPPE